MKRRADVTQVSIARKNTDGQNISSAANLRSLGESYHLKLSSFTLKTESKLNSSFKHRIQSRKGMGEKKWYKQENMKYMGKTFNQL